MMEQLEWWMEVMSEDFNCQTIANTLWAFATKSRKSGERMMEPNVFIATFGSQRFHSPPKGNIRTIASP